MSQTLPDQFSHRPVPPWHFYEAMVALLLAYGVVPLITSSLLQIGWPTLSENHRFILEQCSPFLAWVLIFPLMGKIYRVSMLPYLGLATTRDLKQQVMQGGLAILGILIVVGGVSLLSQFFQVQSHDPYADLPPEKLEAIGFFALATAPVIEELAFRGFLQSTLYRYYTPFWAILLTSLLFALFHTAYTRAPLAQLYVVALGLLFGYLRDRTGSTIPGMIGHLFNNLLATLGLLSD